MFDVNRITNTWNIWQKTESKHVSGRSALKEATGQSSGHARPLLPLSPQAVLSPSALLVHSNVIFFHSLKMFAFFNDLSPTVLVFVVWNVMFAFAQNPLSLTQGSPIRNTSDSEVPSHVISDWVKNKKIKIKTCPSHPLFNVCPSPNLLNPLASTSDWLTFTSCLTSLFRYWPCKLSCFLLAGKNVTHCCLWFWPFLECL